jgi:hypothetical protein
MNTGDEDPGTRALLSTREGNAAAEGPGTCPLYSTGKGNTGAEDLAYGVEVGATALRDYMAGTAAAPAGAADRPVDFCLGDHGFEFSGFHSCQ